MVKNGKLQDTIEEAVTRLKSGDVVAIPTETVYGLAAVASNLSAIKKVFQVKDRPTEDPLILHIADEKQLNEIAEEVPAKAKLLIKAFWPGPLTLVFKKKKNIDGLLTANLNTVAVRMPKHDIALEIIKKVNQPLAAPSANRFQSISPTTAEAVDKELGNKIALIVDGGPCEQGIESTVVSCVDELKILRLGAVAVEDIEMTLGETVFFEKKEAKDHSVPQVSPGLLSFHYAPKTPLRLYNRLAELFQDLEQTPDLKTAAALILFSKKEAEQVQNKIQSIFVLSETGSLTEAAKNFFSTLRRVDERQPKYILALRVPEQGLGRAINDRLQKAQHN